MGFAIKIEETDWGLMEKVNSGWELVKWGCSWAGSIVKPIIPEIWEIAKFMGWVGLRIAFYLILIAINPALFWFFIICQLFFYTLAAIIVFWPTPTLHLQTQGQFV